VENVEVQSRLIIDAEAIRNLHLLGDLNLAAAVRNDRQIRPRADAPRIDVTEKGSEMAQNRNRLGRGAASADDPDTCQWCYTQQDKLDNWC